MTVTTLTPQSDAPARHPAWTVALGAVAVMAATALYARLGGDALSTGLLLTAWIILGFNAVGAWLLYRRALGQDSTRFMLFGFLGSGMRVVATGAMGMLVAKELGAQATPFIATLLIGYFVSLKFEIWILHRHALRHEHL